jgi:hypothetical protein
MATTIPEQIKLSMYDAWTEEIEEHQRDILLARAYHGGNQPVSLTDRQKEFLALSDDNRICINVCRLVVTTLCDELTVIGFDTSEEKNSEGKKPFAEWLNWVWNQNHLDASQSESHEWTVRDGEGYMILGWDDVKKLPTVVLHEAWTSEDVSAWEYADGGVTADMVSEASGTGTGVYIKYKNNDINQPKEFAVQYFYSEEVDENGDVVQIHRRTIYYPDHIEREYMGDNGTWSEYEPPELWVGKDKKPLGIPVVHFKNKDMRPEAWDAIPLQDSVNKTFIDVQGSADFFGFPVGWIIGAYPTTDGKPIASDRSNVFYMQPGQFNGFQQNANGNVSVAKWEGSDPAPLMNTVKDQIMFIAQITGTPATKFIATAQVASAETLKEQKDSLKKRAKNRQISFGDSWEEVMSLARAINNAFGSEQFDEDITITTIWKNIETIEELKDEQSLGVPVESLWTRLGYNAEKVAEMKAIPSYKVAFMKAFWEAYKVAAEFGQTVEMFAKTIGMSDDDIKMLIPPTAQQTNETAVV